MLRRAAFLLIALLASPAAAPRAEWVTGMMDADTLQSVLPAVVSITISKERPASNGSGTVRVEAFGSGYIIDKSGIIVTNRHVIEGAETIAVGLMDKTRLKGTLVAAAEAADVAVVKVDAGHPLPTLEFGDSDKLRVGDPVLAIGNPLGVGMSVSAGIVSALNRNIMDTPYDDYIQTDAAINHGNSGGPLVDPVGRVVGMDTAIYSSEGNTGSIGLGFALPANVVKMVVQHLLDPEHSRPGWVGLRVQEVTPDIAEAVGLTRAVGALVAGVDTNSPAAKAGIREGDVILRYGNRDISDSRELLRLIVISPIGQTIPIVAWRDQKPVTMATTVMQSPTDVFMPVKPPPPRKHGDIMVNYGVSLAPLTEADRQSAGLASNQGGALIKAVEPNSLGAEDGLQPGDVVVKVGDDPVADPAAVQALLAALKAQGRRVAIALVQGKGGPRWVPVLLEEP